MKNDASSPSRPMSGKQLLGWIGDQRDPRDALIRVKRLGRARGYHWRILSWTAAQVADVFHDLTSKPPKGSSQWGGSARSDGSAAR